MSSFNRRTNICAANLSILTIVTSEIQRGPQNDKDSAIMSGESSLGPPAPLFYKQTSSGQSLSSPRRLSTPVGRLTFPPGHQEPDLSRSDDGYQNGTVSLNERPGTSRFKQSVSQGCQVVNLHQFSAGSTRIIRLIAPSHDSKG